MRRAKKIQKALTAGIALALLFALAACGAPLPQEAAGATPTPSFTPSGDIRELVVAALRQPDNVTHVRTVIREPAGPDGQDYVMRAWMDLTNERLRREQLRNDEADYIAVLVDGAEASYSRQGNYFREHQASVDWDSFAQEFGVEVPPYLRNQALMGVHPLSAALLFGEWQPAGTGEWQGRPAMLWEADLPGPELPMHTYTTIYLDPETHLPLGQVLRYAQREGEAPEGESLVTYEITFVSPDSLPPHTFGIAALRDLHAEYGGLLEEAKAQDYTVLWLGRTAQPGGGLPEAPLATVNLRRANEPDGPYVAFHYRGTVEPGDYRSEVSVIVRPHADWERTFEQHPDGAWWTDAERQPVVIDGVEAEYVIGERPRSLPVQPKAIEMIIWLPDSVVRVIASPGLVPTVTPTPPEPGQPPMGMRPLEDMVDVNPFNTEEAMRLVLQALRVLD